MAHHHDHPTHLTVSRTIDAPAPEIFDVLTLPARHAEIDGSGFVVADDHTNRITGTGQTFRMNMNGEHAGGDYQTDNYVTGYDKNTLLAWKTGLAGTTPPGWEWVWELKADGPRATEVTLTYDWSKVDDEGVIQQIGFPLVKEEQLEQSLANLAAAVA